MANWNENSPADTDLISSGDDAIRQLKTDIRERMDNEHVWTSTGANTEGTHAAGFLTNTMVNASAAIAESKLAFDNTTGHAHSGTTGTKVVATNLNVSGLTASQLLRVNSGGTAVESSGKTVPTGTIVGTTDTQTLTNKTLTAPTITDFTNATHTHTGALAGGTLSHNNLLAIGTNTHAVIDAHIAASAGSVHGITASAAELNVLDGMTASTAELNVLDGIPETLTATELGYCDGVTSNIQTQLNVTPRYVEASENLLVSLTNTSTTGWVDVDITTSRPGSVVAKAALLGIHITLTSDDPNSCTLHLSMAVRKNGGTYASGGVQAQTHVNMTSSVSYTTAIVPLDSGEIFEYSITEAFKSTMPSQYNTVKIYLIGIFT